MDLFMLENEAKIRTDKSCVMVSVRVGFRSGPNQHEPEMRERRESMEGVCVCVWLKITENGRPFEQ